MIITKAMIDALRRKYSDQNIVLNPSDNPTEVVVELERDSGWRWGHALALIGSSEPHEHHRITEHYVVLRGELDLMVGEGVQPARTVRLSRKNPKPFVITPHQWHWARGVDQPALVLVFSTPAWAPDDHFLRSDIRP
ncbi:MAG TPA: hypothetical protein VJI33_03995 [Candidatus Paceibacterota bacterium]